MADNSEDEKWMRRALLIAEKGYTRPNPMVGCVLVKDGQKIGEGYHHFAGQPHAEVEAIRSLTESAEGATAYVSLEPCCHFGRTPPCTAALIASRVKRVVVAAIDPDTRVSGKGLEILRAAGMDVRSGVLAERANQLNAAFVHYHTWRSPYTIIKAAMTVDGKIATSTGKSRWITGTESRREVHKMRARSSAVMAGVGTLLADDATLTARLSPPPPVQPMRIIVDSRLRTPVDCSAVRAISEESPLLIATTQDANYDAEQRLIDVGAEVLRLPSTDNRVDLRHLMRDLADRSIISILVEGGAELNASLIRGNLAQRMVVFIAPLLFGGTEARTPVEGCGIDQVESAIRLGKLVSKRYGADVTLEADILPSGVSGS